MLTQNIGYSALSLTDDITLHDIFIEKKNILILIYISNLFIFVNIEFINLRCIGALDESIQVRGYQ